MILHKTRRFGRRWPESSDNWLHHRLLRLPRSVLRHFSEDERAAWKQVSSKNSEVATTLTALGPDKSASLLRHGYCVAMANLHVILGYPLLAIPALEQFRKMTITNA